MSRPIHRLNIKDLIAKNISEIKKDTKLIEKIEKKLEVKHVQFSDNER